MRASDERDKVDEEVALAGRHDGRRPGKGQQLIRLLRTACRGHGQQETKVQECRLGGRIDETQG